MSPGNVIPIRGQRPPGDGPPPHVADPRGDFVYRVTKHGREVEDITANAVVVFRRDPAWAGVIAYDELAQTVVTRRAPPWYEVDAPPTVKPGPWEDSDTIAAHSYLRRKWSITLGKDSIRDAVMLAARAAAFNPVKEWLEALPWDGRLHRLGRPSSDNDPGCPGWLTRYMRANDSDYVRLVGRWQLIASVARVYDPGCKVDTVPIIESVQGKKKGSAMRALYHPWFSDTPIELGSKDKYEQLFGVWGYELAEFNRYNRHEAAVIKAFVSSPTDKFRRAYARCDSWNPRRCAFVASVNPAKPYINDETGGRRWHPYRSSADGRAADVEGIWRDREALWAEARETYLMYARDRLDAGRWWPEGRAEERLCETEQEDRQSVDVWYDKVASFLVGRTPGSTVKPGEVLVGAFNIGPDKWEDKPGGNTDRVQTCLRMLGWVRERDTVAGQDPGKPDKRGTHYRLPTEDPTE